MDCKVPDDVAACTGANAELVDGFFCRCDKCGMVRQTEIVIGRHIDNVASIQIDMTALRAVQCTIHKKTFFLSCLGRIPARFLVYGYHTTKWKKTQMGKRYFSTVLRLFFEWGIELNEPYKPRRSTVRKVSYANRASIEKLVSEKYGRQMLLDENREMLKEQRKAAVQQEAAEWAAKNENTERMRNVKT